MLETKQLTVAIDFHSIFYHTMDVNSYRQLFGYLHSSNSLFWVQQLKKIIIQVWNNLMVSKQWQNFWMNYPL